MGRLAANDSKRGERAARGDEMNAVRTDEASGRRTKPTPADETPAEVVSARAYSRALVALVCASALLASLSLSLRAQSGRKSSTPTAQGRGVATPTPTPIFNQLGPVAEPPPPKDKYAYPARQNPDDALRPPDSTQGARAGDAKSVDAKSGAEEVGDEEVVRVSTSLVPVPASVVDARGHAVTDLKAEDFELRVDGQLRPVAEVSRSETPVSIALLFDNSSSLNEAREFEKKAAVRFLKSVVRPRDRAAVYSISTVPELAQPLTNDVGALVRTIQGFGKPRGATALFDTVAAAADYLRAQKMRRVIVIVSDGGDTVSYLEFNEAMARVLADDCQVYSVQTGNSENANLHDLAGERRLQEFSAQTGGAVYVPHNNAELSEAFSQIAADLSQQYVLSYYPSSADPRDGRFRAITLGVKTRPSLRVRTRKGYYAPKG
jgi:Ca-activated chloride channel homolog